MDDAAFTRAEQARQEKLYKLVEQIAASEFAQILKYGVLSISFENGHPVHVRLEESFKPPPKQKKIQTT